MRYLGDPKYRMVTDEHKNEEGVKIVPPLTPVHCIVKYHTDVWVRPEDRKFFMGRVDRHLILMDPIPEEVVERVRVTTPPDEDPPRIRLV